MRTAILFGGSGFIGTHLAEHLATDHGYAVTSVDLLPPRKAIAGVEHLTADLREPLDPAQFPHEPDLVVNLAAVHREPGHEPHEYYDANVGGAHQLVALLEALAARNVVFVSSISVYGPTEEPIGDDAVPAPTTHYGKSKLEAEGIHLAWRRADPERRRLTIVRPAVVYGPGEGGNFSRLGSAILRKRFFYPGRRDTLKASGYVKDLARAIEYLQRQDDAEGVFNFASQRTYTLEEIVERFSRVAGLKPTTITVPTRLMLLAGAVGDRTGFVGRSVGLSKRRIEKLVTSTNVKADRLGRTGFEYAYDLEEGLRDWFAEAPERTFE